MKEITIKDLYLMCKREMQKGNGDKPVVMTSDDEGNEYHHAWFGLENGQRVAPYITPNQTFHLTKPISECFILS